MSTLPTLTTPPDSITAGDSVQFTVSPNGFRASDGGTLTFALAGMSVLEVTGAANGDAWDVTLTAAQTAALAVGTYRWRLRVAEGATVTTVDTGRLTVEPDLATLSYGSGIGYAERTLAIVEAALTGTLEGEMKMYMIAGRQVQTFSLDELRRHRSALLTEIAALRGEGFGVPVVYSYRGLF